MSGGTPCLFMGKAIPASPESQGLRPLPRAPASEDSSSHPSSDPRISVNGPRTSVTQAALVSCLWGQGVWVSGQPGQHSPGTRLAFSLRDGGGGWRAAKGSMPLFVLILPFTGFFSAGCKIHPLSPGDSLCAAVHLNKYVFTTGSFLKHALCA